MGHHFVPQAYLRCFENPSRPGFIWLHSKRDPMPRQASIEQAAQSRGYYSSTDEEALATFVEAPANPLLAKLRRLERLSEDERLVVAYYIATMIKRVPRQRLLATSLIGPALETVVARVRDQLTELFQTGKLSVDGLASRMDELARLHAKYEAEPPQEVESQVRDPLPTEVLFSAVASMKWWVIRAREPDHFVTSDSPAYFHSSYGVGQPRAEIRFPLSPQIAIHGSRVNRTGPGIEFVPRFIERSWVREFNRSQGCGATSLLLADRPLPFAAALLRRGPTDLTHLVWTSG